MIFDKIENLSRYKIDLSFIEKHLSNSEFIKGKFEIEATQKFGIGLAYSTKNANECLWEAHRKYLDIHVILEGTEIVQISDISKMKSTKEYEDDYELFDGDKEQEILLQPGTFLLLFPNEVHKTSIQVYDSCPVVKNVYKLLLNG